METATKVTPHRRRLRRRRIPRPQLRLRPRRQRLPRPATPHPATRVLIRPIRCLKRRPTETLSMELNGERLPKARMASVSSTPRRTRRNAGTAASTSLTKQGMDTGPARLFPGRSIPATGVNSGSNSMGMAYPAKNEFETNRSDFQWDLVVVSHNQSYWRGCTVSYYRWAAAGPCSYADFDAVHPCLSHHASH